MCVCEFSQCSNNFPRAQIYPWVCLFLFLHSESVENAVKPIFSVEFFQFILWESYVLWTFFHRLKSVCIRYYFFFVENNMFCLSYMYMVCISLNICVCLSNWIESFLFIGSGVGIFFSFSKRNSLNYCVN